MHKGNPFSVVCTERISAFERMYDYDWDGNWLWQVDSKGQYHIRWAGLAWVTLQLRVVVSIEQHGNQLLPMFYYYTKLLSHVRGSKEGKLADFRDARKQQSHIDSLTAIRCILRAGSCFGWLVDILPPRRTRKDWGSGVGSPLEVTLRGMAGVTVDSRLQICRYRDFMAGGQTMQSYMEIIEY